MLCRNYDACKSMLAVTARYTCFTSLSLQIVEIRNPGRYPDGTLFILLFLVLSQYERMWRQSGVFLNFQCFCVSFIPRLN